MILIFFGAIGLLISKKSPWLGASMFFLSVVLISFKYPELQAVLIFIISILIVWIIKKSFGH